MTGIQDALAIVRRALVNGAPPEIYEAAYPALHYVEDEIARLEQDATEWHRIADDNLDRVYVADQRAEAAEAEAARLKDGLRDARHIIREFEAACWNHDGRLPDEIEASAGAALAFLGDTFRLAEDGAA